MYRMRACAIAVAAVLLVLPAAVSANVYATNLSQSASLFDVSAPGSVNLGFLLNEDATAGVSLQVLNSGNTAVRTFSLGALSKGTHSVAWDGKDDSNNTLASGNYSFRVTPMATGYAGWTQISDDTNVNLQFNSPRGVAVNQDASSPLYGRIFVANSAAGAQGDGMFARNADGSDSALGQGNTAKTGGFSWSASASASPWRMEVGSDGKLYISDWSDPHGGVYRTDGNIDNGEQVLDGIGDTANPAVHGSAASSAITSGSTAGGDLKLFVLDEDFTPHQGLYSWDINGGPLPSTALPTLLSSPLIDFAGVTVDLARGPSGNFYLMQNRSAGNEAGIFVTDATGTSVIWDSLSATRTLLGDPLAVDMLLKSRAVTISKDGKSMAIVIDNSSFWVVPLDANGIPDLSQASLQSVGTVASGRDVAMDAVGNVYVSTSGYAKVKIYSPGGANSAMTDSLAPLGAIQLVPEPGSVMALGAGLLSMIGLTLRRKA